MTNKFSDKTDQQNLFDKVKSRMDMMNAALATVSGDTDLYSVLGEPDDPNSDWQDLKYAQLCGCDYVFLSRKINKKLASKTSLSEFMLDVYQILETSDDRMKVYIYSLNNIGAPEFASFNINWERGNVTEFRVSPIQSLEEKEFIRTLYAHSGTMAELA